MAWGGRWPAPLFVCAARDTSGGQTAAQSGTSNCSFIRAAFPATVCPLRRAMLCIIVRLSRTASAKLPLVRGSGLIGSQIIIPLDNAFPVCYLV